jgi:hypothetical protein
VSGGGYEYTVQSANGFRRDASGVWTLFDGAPTEFVFTGRPVSAFAGTVRVVNESGVSIAGTVNVLISTGESVTFNVAAGGTFFGITSTQPFTALHVDSPVHGPPSSAATWEHIDDVYVGTSGTAAAAADQCDDAATVTPNSVAQYPFTTIGATAQAIPGVCDGAIDSGPDVWFRLVATADGQVTATTCGCNFDSILRVFTSCQIAPTGAQIACNDDFCAGGSAGQNRGSRVQFRTIAGEDYFLRISGYDAASGSGTLTFSIVPDCHADFNHSGGPGTVQDIFDFLAAYFGGCP